MHAAPTHLPDRADSDAGASHWSLIPVVATAAALTYYALHRGSYSLTDRQQLAVLVWAAVAVAAIVGLLPRARPTKALWVPYLALFGMAVWTAIGLTYTESDERTYNELARIVGYIGVLTLVWLSVTRHDWRRLAAALPAAAVLVCGLAVLSRFWPSVFPEDEVAKQFGTYRLNYPFGYWNAMGCWAAMSITLCVAWAAHARSAWVRAAALAAVPVCVLALYFTVSRAALGGALLGPAVVLALGGHRWLTLLQATIAAVAGGVVIAVTRGQDALVQATGTDGVGTVVPVLIVACAACAAVAFVFFRVDAGERLRMSPRAARRALVVGAVAAAVVAAVVLPGVAGNAWDQFNQTTPTLAAGADPDARLGNLSGNRVNVWESAIRAGKEQPVRGLGAGVFEFWWNRDGENGEYLRDAHSIYLEAWAEGGLIGLALLLVFLGGLAWAAWCGRRRCADSGTLGVHAGLIGVFAVFLLQSGADWIWESTAVTVMALVAVGIAAAAASERVGAPGEHGGTSASASVAVVLVALVAVVIQLPGLASEANLRASREAAQAGDYKRAVAEATDAIEAMPWAAGGYGQRGLVLEQDDQIQPAVADLGQAIEAEPTNWRWWLLSARALVQQGDASGAAQAVEMSGEYRVHGRLTAAPQP